jgi:hypothetical protein
MHLGCTAIAMLLFGFRYWWLKRLFGHASAQLTVGTLDAVWKVAQIVTGKALSVDPYLRQIM